MSIQLVLNSVVALLVACTCLWVFEKAKTNWGKNMLFLIYIAALATSICLAVAAGQP